MVNVLSNPLQLDLCADQIALIAHIKNLQRFASVLKDKFRPHGFLSSGLCLHLARLNVNGPEQPATDPFTTPFKKNL